MIRTDTTNAERAALSFGLLAGLLTGAILVLLDASPGWWYAAISVQALIVGYRFWTAFGSKK